MKAPSKSVELKLARLTREFFALHPGVKLIAVTGSAGKASAKVAIGTVVAQTMSVQLREEEPKTKSDVFLQIMGVQVPAGGLFRWARVIRAVKNRVKAQNPEVQVIIQEFNPQELGYNSWFREYLMPDIAVVTNIESTHLDHHISLDEYVDAKRNVLIYQSPSQRTVLNADCDYSIGHRVYHDMRYDVRGKLAEFSLEKPVHTGAYIDDNDNIVYAEDGTVTQIMPASDIRLPGRHNIANYCTAIAAVWGLVQPEQIREVARTFGGVEHRIEFVREVDGVKYYNDSIATSPSRVISGVRAFNQKIIAIQGGSDKGNDLSVMVPDLLTHVKILILNGATADKIEQAVLAAPDYDPDQLQIIKVKDLPQAVEAARKAAQPGDIVSLCPACPAFDQFKTFEYRGREFKRLVNAF